jgi:NAD(P)H dehydrogenase (quinone)
MNRRELLRQAGAVSVVLVFALCVSRVHAADPEPVSVLVTYHSGSGNTEKMAQGVADGAKAVPGTSVILKPVGEVAAADLSSSDAVIIGSPVYFGNISGEVKTFLDNWSLKFGLFRDRKMRNKVGGRLRLARSSPAGKNSR